MNIILKEMKKVKEVSLVDCLPNTLLSEMKKKIDLKINVAKMVPKMEKKLFFFKKTKVCSQPQIITAQT
jgi:hypothetical protein